MKSNLDLADELRSIGLDKGLDAFGIASAEAFESTRGDLESRRSAGLHADMHFTYGNPRRSTSPEMALSGARSIIVGARSYRRADPHGIQGAMGSVARYVRSDDYGQLRLGLSSIADRLKHEGWRARVCCDDNALVDREAAYRAGIGWYGKNANLLVEGKGSWFVLGSVVTDAEFAPAKSRVGDGCASCSRCIDGCPTGAIVAPGVVDARRCLAWLLQAQGSFPVQWRQALGGRIYGCDDCQEVCPINKKSERETPLPEDLGQDAWVDLVAILEASDEDLLERYGHWYIPKRQPRYLRRNALVALGNIGDGSDENVARVLVATLRSTDEIVREHATWAALRLGRNDLVEKYS